MALSDVLQFDCSIENEIAQNALKNFTGMLGKAFEQYKSKYISIIYIVLILANGVSSFIFFSVICLIYNNKAYFF